MRRLAAAFLLALPLLASGDILHLKNGTTLEGRAVSEEGDEFPFKLNAGGVIQVKKADIEWIEWSSSEAIKAEIEKRRKPGTVAALLDTAAWAKFHGLKDHAEDAWLAVLRLEPQNDAANAGLGKRKHEGKWLTEDEYRKATGQLKVGGRWVTADEKKKMDEGWEWVDGKLLSPDDLKRSKGLVEYEGKWISKKEYDEIQKKKPVIPDKPPAGNGDKPPANNPPGGANKPSFLDDRPTPDDKLTDAEKKRLHNDKEQAQILGWLGNGWRAYSGIHYRLVTCCDDKDPEFDKKFVASMDRYWFHYLELFEKKPEQKKLHNIMVHQNSATYDEWLRKNAGGAGVGAFGVYSHSMQFNPAILWYRQVDGVDDNVRTTLFTGRHEACHQFVAFYVGGLGGAWFQEGIAALQEPDIPYYLYPYRWDFIRLQVLEGKDDITMADLIKKSGSLDANQVYSRGAATHYFFLNYKDGLYRKKYVEWMCKGSDSPSGLEKAVGVPIVELDKQYREFIKEMDIRRDKEEPKWPPGQKPPGAGNAK
ncbi:MAG: PBS lyase HEAT domain-containing protein repeat-containing [Planctomycetota bacterium]|nr:MAG: PBS lyase HEAT domain-containing protein repeat-containing [Planctomycetota bacterium]